MTQPSDRARKAAALIRDDEMVTVRGDHYKALLVTFERETPGFAAGVEAAAKAVENDGIWSEGYRGCAAAIRNLTPAPPAAKDQDDGR